MSTNQKNYIPCIYCESNKPAIFKIGEGSEEHVILSAIGGIKATRNVCCVACNNRLGDEIDEEFAINLAPIGNLFSIKRGRKRTAPTLSSGESIDGTELKISPGVKFQLKKSSIEESTTENGQVILRGKANTVEEAERLLENYLNKFGDHVTAETTYTLKSTPSPLFSFTLKFEDNQKRSASKMLLNLLATCTNPQRIRSDDLREIVMYINGENQIGFRVEPWLNMEIPNIPSKYKFGHAAIIVASAKKNIVVGVLILFGTIKVTVLMSNSWSGPMIGKMYFVDPCNGTHENVNFDAENYAATYPKRDRPDNADLKSDMTAMIVEAQRRHRLHRIEELLAEIRKNLPPEPTPEQLNAVLSEAIKRFVLEALRIPYEKRLEK